MALSPGTHLGSYEILAPIGAGGMGEVYRAKDAKLNRDVAIKVLPESFALDADRVARFRREAQVLASLNHPNIAAIYGIETNALVMELVEGEDLSAIIARGAMPLVDALPIAKQIADALEAAHEQGIVHRDLKPQNIKVRADGTVKVLDFGLAKAMDPAGSASGEAMNSPTMTARATQMGMIIGTAAYMSPEQARGRAVDRRADIWAFGVVMYEMLAGTRAFEGEDISITLANVLKDDVKWDVLPADVPPAVQNVLRRCLERDPKKRLSWIGEAKAMLDDPTPAVTPAAASARASSWPWRIAAAVFVLTTLGAAAGWYRAGTVAPALSRFLVLPPDGAIFTSGNVRGATVPSISPDGRMIAFTGQDAAGNRLLWVRAIDSLAPRPIAGTEGAGYPFWSPDSREIGYTITEKLMRVPAAGGPSTMICALNPGIFARGGTWSPDGVVIFNNGPAPLYRAPASGGSAVAMGVLGSNEGGRQFPHFLPDGRHYLYSGSDRDGLGVFTGVLGSDDTSLVAHAQSGGVYDRASQRILFVRQGRLMAQAFDTSTRTVSGDPVSVAEGVESSAVPGLVAFSVSETGILAYGAGASAEAGAELVWLDRSGKTTGTLGPSALYRGLSVSPDGLRLAAHRHEWDGGDIYVTDLATKRSMRLTFDANQENNSPIWSPGGDRIAYGSIRAGVPGIYVKAANNTGVEEQLYSAKDSRFVVPLSWSADGQWMVFGRTVPGANRELWRLSMVGDRKAGPMLSSQAAESRGSKTFGQISSDGRWLAYASGETGANEIYVQPVSGTPGKWPVSIDGGNLPLWRGDSKELFYLSKSGKVMAVAVTARGAAFVAGDPQPLFDVPILRAGNGHADFFPYAVSKDGRQFLFPRGDGSGSTQSASGPLVVVVNWIDGIKK